MSPPKLGDKAACKLCGKPIEYVGPYWRHIGSMQGHQAAPAQAPLANRDDQASGGGGVFYSDYEG